MSAARRYLSRPRTKLYDYNYVMGERLYRGMVDSLDKPRAARSSAEAVDRHTYAPPPPPPTNNNYRNRSYDEGSEEEDSSLRKIRAARAKMEEEVRAYEESSNARRAALKNQRVDVSDRLLDSVGISRRSAENGDYEYSSSNQHRRAVTELEEDPFFKKRTFQQQAKYQFEEEDEAPVSRLKSKQRNLFAKESDSPDFDTAAALDRAKKSRARLAEIENEMDELNERSRARGARMASAQAVLREAAECESSVSATKSVRVKRAIQVTERVG
ncbi:uncharacterized protein LOC132198189 [Neocloeon triangulifer]|uniref:uncharacterized protein LOC132198189 n=1 Tax=Neocloeon triangulifer TaxID=2078957 RepID=UPI00286F201A|nr:uncharacterized protein LOC132198189 [Neocloeon triangulifer]